MDLAGGSASEFDPPEGIGVLLFLDLLLLNQFFGLKILLRREGDFPFFFDLIENVSAWLLSRSDDSSQIELLSSRK